MVKRILRIIGWLNPFRWLGRAWFSFRNWRRRRFKHLDYVYIALAGTLPTFDEPRGWLRRRFQGDTPLSVTGLERLFQQIADDPRTQGVVLHLRAPMLPLGDLQSIRNSILRLRERGKRVVCYSAMYTTGAYYLASVADEIILQPGGLLMTTGIQQGAAHLKDALDRIGVTFDVIAISPYKGAGDTFSRSEMSPEAREQLNWLLDSRYDMIVRGIAEGRGLTPDAVRDFIDNAPYVDTIAHEKGFVDAVCHESELPAHLNDKHLVPRKRAEKLLLKKRRKSPEKVVALLHVSGTIVDGESVSPPVDVPLPLIGGERVGDVTLIQKIRRLMQNADHIGAVILFMDTPGGSTTASEAMVNALHELADKVPIVVYMNNVSASGGYYLATAGNYIVAQPGTITGSIGVVSLRPVTGGLLEKAQITYETLHRGQNADLFDVSKPYTEQQRQQVRGIITHIYDQFIARVVAARDMRVEAVHSAGGGRVWTGEQALAHGLVDELGDLQTALKKARELGDLPEDAPLAMIREKAKFMLMPQVKNAEALNPFWQLRHLANGVKMLSQQPQMLMPIDIDVNIR